MTHFLSAEMLSYVLRIDVIRPQVNKVYYKSLHGFKVARNGLGTPILCVILQLQQ